MDVLISDNQHHQHQQYAILEHYLNKIRLAFIKQYEKQNNELRVHSHHLPWYNDELELSLNDWIKAKFKLCRSRSFHI